MDTFDLFVNSIVIASMLYVTFGMALAGWIAGLRKGQAVTLVPVRGGKQRSFWMQMAVVFLSLVLLGVFIYFLWIPVPLKLSAGAALALKICGLVLFLAGVAFTLWARRTLGRMWGISKSTEVKLLDDHQLIQEGPYALIRHPMYFGWWVALLGSILIYHTWLLVVIFASSIFIFYKRARREEAVLSERFGAAWQEYARKSKFLIPFLY